MSEYQQMEKEYDAWLRWQVQAAIDDARLNKPHEEVMAHARSVLKKLINGKINESNSRDL